MRLRMFITILCVALATISGVARQAAADQIVSFLRDAEIENIIRTWWTPISQAAGLDPQAVHIYVVNDPTLNSFVAGGQNLFLNSGTILRSQSPNQLVGIMAHETGHIAGGHLARSDEAMHNATIASIIAMVAGAAAAVAGHNAGRRRRRRCSAARAVGAALVPGHSRSRRKPRPTTPR